MGKLFGPLHVNARCPPPLLLSIDVYQLLLVKLYTIVGFNFATLSNCWDTLRACGTKVGGKLSTGQEKTWVR